MANVLVPAGQHDSSQAEVPGLKFGHLQKVTLRDFRPEPIAKCPGGTGDRSLARSAWDGAIQNSRPVGYGMIRAGVQVSEPIRVIGGLE